MQVREGLVDCGEADLVLAALVYELHGLVREVCPLLSLRKRHGQLVLEVVNFLLRAGQRLLLQPPRFLQQGDLRLLFPLSLLQALPQRALVLQLLSEALNLPVLLDPPSIAGLYCFLNLPLK